MLAVDQEIAEPFGSAHEFGGDHEHPAEPETLPDEPAFDPIERAERFAATTERAFDTARRRTVVRSALVAFVITATFGGVLRDVVCNEIPTAFSDHRPYAICAFIGGWVLVLAQHAGLAASLALVLGAACATGLRVAALLTGFTLPRWSSGDAA